MGKDTGGPRGLGGRSLFGVRAMKVALAAVAVALVLAACSSGEEPTAAGGESPPIQPVGPSDWPDYYGATDERPTPVTTAVAAESAAAVPPPDPAAEPEIPADVDQEPETQPTPEQEQPEGLETVILTPLEEFVDFPNDVAIIYRDGVFCYEGCSWQLPLYRLYKRGEELAREELFTASHPIIQAIEPYGNNVAAMYDQVMVTSTADGSRMVAVLCHRTPCYESAMAADDYYYNPDVLPLPPTDLYESTDGGVTWHRIDTVERPWTPQAITAGSAEREALLLLTSFSYHSSVNWGGYMLWSSSGVEIEEKPFLTEEEYETLSDAEKEELNTFELIERMEAEGVRESPDNRFTGELPKRGPRYPRTWGPLLHAVQFGPFLRVADDLDGCLLVLADHSPNAEELDCMASRVLLTGLGETIELEGTTWHSVRTPAGIEGWADGRYLE